MSFRLTFMHKLLIAILCTVVGFTGLSVASPSQASAASSKADKIIALGNKYLGVKYKFGAKAGITSAFDCSSFTQYVFGKYGVKLPRVSSDQAKRGVKVAKANLKKGDLVFFRTARTGSKIGHVAIYAGNNKMLHTYGAGGVKYTSMSSSYWKARYVTARRVL